MQYDCLTSRLITQAKLTLDGNVHDLVFAHHIRTTGEMVSQLEEAGFGPVDLFADVNEQPFAPGSQQLLLVATAR